MSTETDLAAPDADEALVARRTLVDDEQQAEFSRAGYLTLTTVGPEQVARLRAIYDEVFPEQMQGFIPTYAVATPERKARANELVKEVLEPLIGPLFDRHRAFNSSYLMKWPGDDSALPLHQDTCYVDERVFRSAVVWVALDDTDEELDNGPLQVIPGSHRFDRLPRGTRTWWPYDQAAHFAEEHCTVALPARAGEALMMDNALIHCSFPNRSSSPRLAVAISMAPEEAGLIHAVGHDDARVSLHDVDEEFFVQYSPYGLAGAEFPDTYPRREVRPIEFRQLTPTDLAALCHLPEELVDEAALLDRQDPAPSGDAPADDAAAVDPHGSDLAADGQVAGGDEGSGAGGGPGRIGTAVLGLMQANNRLVGHAVTLQPVYDPADFAWTAMLEQRWEDIRDEARAVLETRRVPRIEQVLGVSQGNDGEWNTFVLRALRKPVDFNAELCPVTSELVAQVPGISSALFSVFQPGTHLPSHQAPNRGVLRYHLGLIVPDPPDSCQLRVLDDVLSYREGESILFDDTFEHEAWNRAAAPRVTLLLELDRPLRTPYRQFNALTQRAFAFYPEARGAAERLEKLEWELNGGR
ncbi:MAG: aspartyl/asparaginyl beta-hydroxylase domain-containing protein [Acidimicrobiales bacterium]|nr:aspartyl/asparaginyl beta-hydroxylase domain-containing protein [Acidimicrobiales bacterium]